MNKLFRIFNESQQSHHFGKNWKAAEDIEFKVGCSIVKLSACLSSLSQVRNQPNWITETEEKNQKQLTFLSLHFTLRKAKSISIPILSILKRKYFLRHMIHVLTMVLYSLDSSMEISIWLSSYSTSNCLEMPVNEEDVVNIMGGMPEGIRLNDHRRRLKNR